MELIETCFLTSVVTYHKSVTLGGSTEHFNTKDGFKLWLMQNTIKCASNNAVREFRNPCGKYANVGLMMWIITQDKKQWLTKQIIKK